MSAGELFFAASIWAGIPLLACGFLLMRRERIRLEKLFDRVIDDSAKGDRRCQ